MTPEGATKARREVGSGSSWRGARRVEAAALIDWKPSVLRPWPVSLQAANERVTLCSRASEHPRHRLNTEMPRRFHQAQLKLSHP